MDAPDIPALAPDGPVTIETWLGAPARSYPGRPPTVLDVLDRAVRRWPEEVAFLDTDGSATTYAGFADLVEGTADRLRQLSIEPRDAVAVAARNSLPLAVLPFACARIGAVMVGLNTRLAAAQWGYMVDLMGAVLTVAAPDLLDAAPGDRVVALNDVVAAAPWRYTRAERPDEASTYAVVFTSGTTGRPKASEVVHRCSVHSAISYQRILRLRPGERTAVFFPLYYISALHAHVLPAMLAGATSVLVDTGSPRDLIPILQRQRVAWAYAVPSVWLLAARLPRFGDLAGTLRVLGAGGAPFPAGLVATLRERLPGVELLDVYGLSETHSPATILRDHEFATHPGSVGRALPCMEAQVRDDDGLTALAAGEAGELWLRGSLVTTGYARDPAASAAAIRAGWLDTGDVARIDPDGFVYVLDRSKDMINRGGNKVFSAEVEQVLRAHPAIEDAAVVGVPDAVAGEAVVAFVVASAFIDGSAVRAWVRERIAEHAMPREVHLVDALPRNAVGKTDKARLRERARATRGG